MLLVILFIITQVHGVDIGLEDICGNKLVGTCPDSINTKVVGGDNSCAEKVPWNVLIELVKGPKISAADGGVYPYCGGVLISAKHVLSAAHCFWTNENPFGSCPRRFLQFDHEECERQKCPASCSRIGPEDVRLHLGVSRRSEVVKGKGEEVERIIIHPGWDRTSKLNDILAGHDLSLIVMKNEVDMYNIKTIPICLPDPVQDKFLTRRGRSADVTGFGLIFNPVSGGRKHPDVVQTASVTITDKDTCKTLWGITGDQICAAGDENIVIENSPKEIVADSCNGDSGGGLTGNNVDGREVVLGIVSFGEPDCGRIGGKPGVYTNVADHVDWIKENIANDKEENTASDSEDVAEDTNESDDKTVNSNLVSSGGIGLKCKASNGKFCKFPFKFQGKVFASCTSDFDPEKRSWCSTKVDSRGVHISGQGEYGYCPPSCQSNILTTPPPPSSSWSAWSRCSVPCGGGSQVRTNAQCPPNRIGCASEQTRKCNTQPCPPSPSPTFSPSSSSSSGWTSWSTCSVSCGGGTQLRKRQGNQQQTQGCNITPCPSRNSRPVSRPTFVSRPPSSSQREPLQQPLNTNTDNTPTPLSWLVGGDSEGAVESLYSLDDTRLCGRLLAPLPEPLEAAPVAGYSQGRVYVCGGSGHCYSSLAARPGKGWVRTQSLLVNTTRAGVSVAQGQMYVFGGSRQPRCDLRPQVQVFSGQSQTWSFLTTPAPSVIGEGSCAVTAGRFIFVIGGFHNRGDYTNRCREKLSSQEKEREEKNLQNYQDRVLVLDTKTNKWFQGPSLNTRRRDQGCTLGDFSGRHGIMVAGGYNSQNSFLTSVEFLDLGVNLGQIQFANLKWRNLPELKHSKSSSLMLVNSKNYVHAIGGDVTDMNLIESFNKVNPRWTLNNYKLKRRRNSPSAAINVESNSVLC